MSEAIQSCLSSAPGPAHDPAQTLTDPAEILSLSGVCAVRGNAFVRLRGRGSGGQFEFRLWKLASGFGDSVVDRCARSPDIVRALRSRLLRGRWLRSRLKRHRLAGSGSGRHGGSAPAFPDCGFQPAQTRQDPALKTTLSKIGDEIIAVNELLNKFELEIQYQEQTNSSLKELCESLEEECKDVEHLKEHVPPHLPQVTATQSLVPKPELDPKESDKVEEPVLPKKPPKEQRIIKEMQFITMDEFNDVPAYMKSRLTYCQINDIIKEINKAVVSKYKIMHQPKASMSSVKRNLYQRFINEETKDTKGHHFIVEADIKEFTALKVDKRFYVIMHILRHCHRLSEVRGGGLTRYVIT
ncbi:spindle and kinetochore-associated protein 1 [Mus caroli]|nr:spindle and kinetochore-associated protein 1 [Mus caroli]